VSWCARWDLNPDSLNGRQPLKLVRLPISPRARGVLSASQDYTESDTTVNEERPLVVMKLPLFPLHTVLFPGMALPLHIFEPRYRLMINECLKAGGAFGIVLIHSGREVGAPAVPHTIGTTAHISGAERLPDGRLNIEVVGQQRFRILDLHQDQAYLTGTIEEFPLAGGDERPARRSARALLPWLGRYLSLLGDKADAKFDPADMPRDPTSIGYLAAIVAQIPMTEKQRLLGVVTAAELLEHERAIYRREIALLRAMLGSDRPADTTSFSPN
jgi:Lon protease-like protein